MHLSEKTHKCTICGAEFKHKKYLSVHKKNVHHHIYVGNVHHHDRVGNVHHHNHVANGQSRQRKLPLDPLVEECIEEIENTLSEPASTSDANIKITNPRNEIQTIYRCKKCRNYSSTFKSRTRVHVESIHFKKSIPCGFCAKKLTSERNLRRHINAAHGKLKGSKK